MLTGRVELPPSPPVAMLVVASGLGEASAVSAAVNTVSADVRMTHALSIPAALGALAEGTFDCVLVEVGVPDAVTCDVLDALRRRAGRAALVAVVDDDAVAPDLTADRVVTTADLVSGGWTGTVRDAIEHARLRSDLRTAEESVARLSGIVDSVSDAVFTTTGEGVVTSWNKGAEQLYGYPAAEILGADIGRLHPPGSDEPRRILAMLRAGETVHALETVRRTRDGQMAEVSMSVTPQRNEDGELTGAVVVARDISDRLELEAELVRQTMHDALTGLPNRAYLAYRLSQSLVEGRRRNSPVAVLFVDLDQFKAVNDVHGHLAGDRVLAEVAGRLRSLSRPTDTVARLGGDEFVLVCPDTDVDAAGRMAEQVIDAVGAPIRAERRDLRIGASIGIAVSSPLETDAETLLKHADAAMYEAKSRGRARSQVFDVSFAERAREQHRLASELREALAGGRLDVHYQPVLDLASDSIIGIEALARWHHPQRGPVPPGTFVPLAEDHGFVSELDRWVLSRACRDLAERRATGELPERIRVAVNLSARSLDDPGLVDMVADVTAQAGLPPQALILEITETALLQNREIARASLEGLRRLGAGVSLDDFGTGYSSLSFLRELPVTVVKIDRSFISNAVERSEDLAITEAIIRLAHGLGMETIAEGVETVQQRDLLRQLGCVSAQGYWWSAAVPMLHVVESFGFDHGPARTPPPADRRTDVATARRWPVPPRWRTPQPVGAAGPLPLADDSTAS